MENSIFYYIDQQQGQFRLFDVLALCNHKLRLIKIMKYGLKLIFC